MVQAAQPNADLERSGNLVISTNQLCRFPDNSSRCRRLEKTRTDAKGGISLGSHRRRRGPFCCAEMGFMSFAGRVLFSAIFLLSAYLE